MRQSPLLSDWKRLPKPADAERAESGLESWREAAEGAGDSGLSAFARDLAGDPAGRALLEAVFGNSPFLTRAILAEPAFLRRAVEEAPDALFPALLSDLEAELGPETDTARLKAGLRVAKRRVALLVALADIAGAWPLESVTGSLSTFAETALDLAVGHLLRRAAGDGQIRLPDESRPVEGSGYFVLGMGKLGAGELNYSSDIDLVVLFDDERTEYTGRRSIQDFMVRLTRDLVAVMEERTAEGYVFRTDLRLRPDPGATPMALSALAAETYYESLGQNWERAAMIKARSVAGDREAADLFMRNLVPFVWRKHLDFAAIEDIHSIKRQIAAHRGGTTLRVPGHNLKLGRGGIREIEFFAQTQQLIWGGRTPELRVRRTIDALDALVAAGRVEEGTARDLAAAYRFLRTAEHRLQMVDDFQVNKLPADEAELDSFAVFCGFDGRDSFSDTLLGHLKRVEKHYGELFQESPSLGGPGNLVFTGAEFDPETLKTLDSLGFKNPEAVFSVIKGWHHGRYQATRSTRARELLTELMPALLEALSKTANPDAAFIKFDEFLSRLPAGVQLFSLFHANPALLDLVAEIMGSAPRLAERLAHRPILLDGVLSTGFYDPLPDAETLADELEAALSRARDFEDALDITRRWTADKKFQQGVHILRNMVAADTAGPVFADIAETVIRGLQPWVEDEFARRHGRIPEAGMSVIGMGKLGGREMMVGSDLDLVFVYTAPADDAESDGEKRLGARTYFARLSRRLINAITVLTAEGRLYEVDMRLRPSGSSGPIASSLEAFERYQRESAWTWELQALTRARALTGPEDLRESIAGIVKKVLTRRRDPARLAADVAHMRARMEREHGAKSVWDIKYARGGLIDVEFIAQYMQLAHAHAHPEILDPNTIGALARAAEAGVLDRDAADELIAAAHLWQRVLGLMRLCYLGALPEEDPREGPRRLLVTAAGADGFADLERRMERTAGRVRALFRELVETPAAEAPPAADDDERDGEREAQREDGS